MNYALDALWWRLQHPTIRDLASLLTAPQLWNISPSLSSQELLGTQGFRLLLEWDAHPPATLPQHQPNERLGHYAERLLAYWFEHAPHCQLLAHSLPIYEHNRTLGEIDFLVFINHIPTHIELCCKYYGGDPRHTLIGLNPQDTLYHKQQQLIKQLQLPHSPAGQAALHHLGIQSQTLRSLALTRGMLFTPQAKLPEKEHFSLPIWTGHWGKPTVHAPHTSRFHILPRHRYLSPARVSQSETLYFEAIAPLHTVLLAQVELRDDGYWHETQRYMITADQ